jgi:hypothetical protein
VRHCALDPFALTLAGICPCPAPLAQFLDLTSLRVRCSSDRVIAAANYDLHIVHCQRNLERCTRCGEMVARARSAEHFDEVHAPVSVISIPAHRDCFVQQHIV